MFVFESFWKEGKVKNRIVKTIGQSKEPRIIERYKEIAKKLLDEHKKGITQLSQLSETLCIDLLRFITWFCGTSYEQLGFKNLIKSGRSNKGLSGSFNECAEKSGLKAHHFCLSKSPGLLKPRLPSFILKKVSSGLFH